MEFLGVSFGVSPRNSMIAASLRGDNRPLFAMFDDLVAS